MSERKWNRVAVCMGGPSSEREVSLRSGKAVAEGLRGKGYAVDEVVVDQEGNFAWPTGAEVAFIAMHGKFGEDGQMQARIEALGVPHTGSGPEASARAFDKSLSKPAFAVAGVPTAPFELLRRGETRSLPLPVAVKPVRQGSSVGVSLVFREEDWAGALELALSFDDVVLVEEFVPGRELTAGVVGETVLPLVEIVTKEGWFDFGAKYTLGAARHLIPAPVDHAVAERCRTAALAAFQALGCRGMGRVDFRLRPDGKIFALELNNIPGFTQVSLLPDAAKAYGWNFGELCERVLNLAE